MYRRMKLDSPAKQIIDLYQDTIYNYTKYKNSALWESPVFYLLFKIFIEKGHFESFLEKEYPEEKDILIEIGRSHFEDARTFHEQSNN